MAEQINTKLDIQSKLAKDGVITSADFAQVANPAGQAVVADDAKAKEAERRKVAEAKRAEEYAAIPQADRDIFEQAVLHDGRFTKSYSLLGGKFKVSFQSRTVRESSAALQALRKYSDSLRLSNPETRTVMDAALLALQLTNLNGTEYPAITGQLVPTVAENGDKSDPEWYGRLEKWLDASEARLSLVLGAYREFEQVYASLCEKAAIANF